MNIVPTFDTYQNKYSRIEMRREDGILEMKLNSDGSDIIWDFTAHEELGYAFEDVGRDHQNKVIILTGAGSSFIAREDLGGSVTAADWVRVHFDAKRLIMSHLDIEAPMIAAFNGPATVHAELGLLCDICIAADHTYFQDAPHAPAGLVPGDGVQVVWPMLLGMNRARYFLLTGERIEAVDAKALGLVGEVLPADAVLDRAWELARKLAARPDVSRRFARPAIVQQIKKLMLDNLGYGLALEGLGAVDYWPQNFAQR
jgi:enoyl-CoA hydratase/carnithine racemase